MCVLVRHVWIIFLSVTYRCSCGPTEAHYISPVKDQGYMMLNCVVRMKVVGPVNTHRSMKTQTDTEGWLDSSCQFVIDSVTETPERFTHTLQPQLLFLRRLLIMFQSCLIYIHVCSCVFPGNQTHTFVPMFLLKWHTNKQLFTVNVQM